jgi:D-arabinose 1-dehydrogenase
MMGTRSAEAEHVLARLPPLIMGGAGFSYQLHSSPESLPAVEIIKGAFDLGLRAIDTSPYYEPSEQIMGAALCHPDITTKYQRSDYILITKAGRITEKKFDYSPAWIKESVARSLQRFGTDYLDVVFCHDVEFVSIEEVIEAVGTLFELSDGGVIRCVGISGYNIDFLVEASQRVQIKYGRPLDIVQIWAQLTLQNTQLEQKGLAAFQKAGVRAVCSSSPLAVGLLRNGGVPLGALGNWHPAPPELRAAAQSAAEWVESQGGVLSSVALRFAIAKAQQNSRPGFTVTTITGIGSLSDLEQNVATARKVLRRKDMGSEGSASQAFVFDQSHTLDTEAVKRDARLYEGVRQILGSWLDFDLTTPPIISNGSSQKVQDGNPGTSGNLDPISRL